jgi:hypothetical protein
VVTIGPLLDGDLAPLVEGAVTGSPTATVGVSSDDPADTLTCTIDGSSVDCSLGSAAVGSLGDGPHTFEATATDAVDGALTVTNDAPAVFPGGPTDVTFTATDDSGNTTSGVVVVTVTDTVAPVLTLPADITVNEDGASGAAW